MEHAGRNIVLIAWGLWLGLGPARAESADLLREAAEAARSGKLVEAIGLSTQAIQAAPKGMDGYRLRASLYAAVGDHNKAIEDYDQLLKLDPQLAEAYDERGSQRFMLGQIAGSIDDFDRFLTLRPQQAPRHWKRGISYYYAGRFDEGRRQFEGYQTVDDNDVENAVWRYLCMARMLGVPAARDALLKIRADSRVPMMQIYALYGGKALPQDVLAAARAGSPAPEALNARLFYAQLYLGLFYEAAGEPRLAREHIDAAVEQKIGHYMWNVAQVHARLLKMAANEQ